MAVVDADYATVVGYIRTHLASGTSLSAYEMGRALAVIQDSLTRGTTDNTAQEAVRTSLTTQITATATQATAVGTTIRAALVVLDATACAAAAGATAAAVIATQCTDLTTAATAITAIGTALTTAKASILTGEFTVPSITTNTVADGT